MKRNGFTLAEVLITLSIIGIIAAIVIPSLLANVNEKAFDAQRSALYARMSQAIPLMDKITGYGTFKKETKDGEETVTDTVAETFITQGLSKVIKVNSVCVKDNLADCNFPDKFTALNGSTTINLSNISSLGSLNNKFSSTDTAAAAFETANGESILVYYNPSCTGNFNEVNSMQYVSPKMCVNFVYDLNGIKAPNTVGKDIGAISVLYSSNPVVVAPMPVQGALLSGKQTEAAALCKNKNQDYKIPNREELASMRYNNDVLFGNLEGWIWSSTPAGSNSAWALYKHDAYYSLQPKTNSYNIACIKR